MILGGAKSALGSFLSALWGAPGAQALHNVSGTGSVTLQPISAQGFGSVPSALDDETAEILLRAWQDDSKVAGRGRVELCPIEADGIGTLPVLVPAYLPGLPPVWVPLSPVEPPPPTPIFSGSGAVILVSLTTREAVGRQWNDLEDLLALLDSAA